jgi:hypothetical protein
MKKNQIKYVVRSFNLHHHGLHWYSRQQQKTAKERSSLFGQLPAVFLFW